MSTFGAVLWWAVFLVSAAGALEPDNALEDFVYGFAWICFVQCACDRVPGLSRLGRSIVVLRFGGGGLSFGHFLGVSEDLTQSETPRK